MSQRTAAVIALALGLGLLAGAGQFARNARQLTTVGERVPGTVMDFQRRSSKGGSSEYPVIEFTTTTGDTRHFTTSGAGDYARGEKVEVLYHPPIRTAPRWMPSWSCGGDSRPGRLRSAVPGRRHRRIRLHARQALIRTASGSNPPFRLPPVPPSAAGSWA